MIPGVTRVLVFSYLQPILGFPVIGQAIAHDQAAITDIADNYSQLKPCRYSATILTDAFCLSCVFEWLGFPRHTGRWKQKIGAEPGPVIPMILPNAGNVPRRNCRIGEGDQRTKGIAGMTGQEAGIVRRNATSV